ncbi:hypothetical protein [Herbaspirillum huttiense]|uniref:Uncharacterized protein n=1 Tax=Herbaspirillum huttiense subsp. lycopersici TaxID=3074428 RepID=A0ABU2EPV1_9BURK|nr:hypothetical protein [Herbaspirillum huttiense]MDR9850187.1 hypothetical protein [Herbaspirillum huttiense SE1]
MLYGHTKDIARRHLRVLTGLAEMSQEGEIVNDLVRMIVRRCFLTMQAAGADCADVRNIFGCALLKARGELDSMNLLKDSVFQIAEQHLELLLFFEERADLVISNDTCVSRTRMHH